MMRVPVDARRLGQLVGHIDAHAIALDGLNGRPVNPPVVAPAMRFEARRKLVVAHLLRDEMKDLHAIHYFIWQRDIVGSDNRRVVFPRFARRSGGVQRRQVCSKMGSPRRRRGSSRSRTAAPARAAAPVNKSRRVIILVSGVVLMSFELDSDPGGLARGETAAHARSSSVRAIQ